MDVAVIGGGIVGCALAAFLAEGGGDVTLYEREAVAAGASGRNSGVLQHPFDDALVGLYEESLRHYAELDGFALPPEPSGLLVVSRGPLTTERFPELKPQLLESSSVMVCSMSTRKPPGGGASEPNTMPGKAPPPP